MQNCLHSGISTVWKACAQEKVWKEIFQMLTVIFLGNENCIIGQSYCLYIFLHLPSFWQGSFVFWEEKTQVWKTNAIGGPKLFSWKVMSAFTSHPAHSPAGNLMYSRSTKCHHLQMTDTYVPSAGHSSKLQNCASMWLLDNSLWWLTRTLASTCCLSLLPTLQIFFPLVSVNSHTVPIFLLWVIR